MGELNGQVEEMYAGHVVVKAFGAQESAERAFASVNEKLYRSAWKSQFLSGLMQPITTFVGNLGYVAAVVLGSGYAAAGVIAVGRHPELHPVRAQLQPAGIADRADLQHPAKRHGRSRARL